MAAQVHAVALPPPVRLQGAAHPLPECLGVGVGAERVLSELLALTLEELHATVLHLETDRQTDRQAESCLGEDAQDSS